MEIKVFSTKDELAGAAAKQAAAVIRRAVAEKGEARLIAATGAAQFEFLAVLTNMPDLPWERVIFFHLDEYVNLPASHPASFRRFLRERIIERAHPRRFHLIEGDAPDAHEECRRLGALISEVPIDLAFVGIGENGHLAFNDPPADFVTTAPYIVVDLDEACRLQQVGEGWFPSLEDVPQQAISMSIQQILRTDAIMAIVPELRKARAVAACLAGEITTQHPASILQSHAQTIVYLDADSASLLRPIPRAAG